MFKELKIKKTISVDTMFSGFEKTYYPAFSFPGEQHNFWELNYVVDGCMEFIKDNTICRANKGEIIFFAPNVFHSVRSVSDTVPKMMVIAFELLGSGYEKLYDGTFSIGETEDAIIRSIVDAYQTCLTCDDEIKNQIATNKTEELLLTIIGNGTPDLSGIKSVNTEKFRLITNTLNDNIFNNISLNDIADLCDMSPSNVKKIFKQFTGRQVMNYYNSLRISRSKVLIREGKTMSEVSETLKFPSQDSFSVTFKKHVGMKPSEFKTRFLKYGDI